MGKYDFSRYLKCSHFPQCTPAYPFIGLPYAFHRQLPNAVGWRQDRTYGRSLPGFNRGMISVHLQATGKQLIFHK